MRATSIVARNECHSFSPLRGPPFHLQSATTEKRRRWMAKTSDLNRPVTKRFAREALGNVRHMCVTQGSGAAQLPFCLSVAGPSLPKASTTMALSTLVSSCGDASCKALGWRMQSRVVRRVPPLLMDDSRDSGVHGDWSLSSSCSSLYGVEVLKNRSWSCLKTKP